MRIVEAKIDVVGVVAQRLEEPEDMLFRIATPIIVILKYWYFVARGI